MKTIIPTYNNFLSEDNREDAKNYNERYKKKTKQKKELLDIMKRQRKKGNVGKSELTKIEIDIIDQELDTLKSKVSLSKEKEKYSKK